MSKKLVACLMITAVIGLSGCKNIFRAYHIDVPQGQEITLTQAQQIKVGMTPAQVRYVLGTPLLTDTLNPQRWDYSYRFIPGTYAKEQGLEAVERRRVSIYFDLGAVSQVEIDGQLPSAVAELPASQDQAVRSKNAENNPRAE